MNKYFKTKNNKGWYGFEPEDKTDLIEITKEEWENHILELEEAKRISIEEAANKPIEEPQPTKEELMAKLAEIQEQLNKM